MSVATTDYSLAIAHLPAAAVLRLDNVPWEEYEQLLADLGPGYAVRIFYDRGRMEIMGPSAGHERPKNIMATLVAALRDELDIDVESLGSTTFRSELKAKGAEPDDCFFIKNASLIIGSDVDDYDLERMPPPDIAVEVDRTNASLDKFVIYAALGVPELWRVHKKTVRIYLLSGDHYSESATSRAFPFLASQTLSEFLALGLAEGGRKAARAFRAWLREQQQSC
jgi:Uma2 family endonuclease